MIAPSHYIKNSAYTILTVSNLPNNSFTSIFAVFPSYRGVVTLQARRCLRGLHGRTRSSLSVWRKIFPAPCGHEVFVLKNLVRPNLYTEKPLKRNDRYDRKTHQKKCRINERQIRIRNSLPPLSNPHQNQKSSNNESDKDFQNSLTRPCSRPLCPLSVGSVLHRWSSRSPRMRCVAGDMEYHPRRILPRVYHRSFCLVINTLIT